LIEQQLVAKAASSHFQLLYAAFAHLTDGALQQGRTYALALPGRGYGHIHQLPSVKAVALGDQHAYADQGAEAAGRELGRLARCKAGGAGQIALDALA
jgi:hypothetical protein